MKFEDLKVGMVMINEDKSSRIVDYIGKDIYVYRCNGEEYYGLGLALEDWNPIVPKKTIKVYGYVNVFTGEVAYDSSGRSSAEGVNFKRASQLDMEIEYED